MEKMSSLSVSMVFKEIVSAFDMQYHSSKRRDSSEERVMCNDAKTSFENVTLPHHFAALSATFRADRPVRHAQRGDLGSNL